MGDKRTSRRRPRQGKLERYIQPSILLALFVKPSHGYELIQGIQEFGFVEGQAPPGMIYRHLRQMEEDGLVSSQWLTEESGPAKRVYSLSSEGVAMLEIWVGYMENQASKLNAFVDRFRQERQSKSEGS
jgi:PadR family transcriptional regulator PadR